MLSDPAVGVARAWSSVEAEAGQFQAVALLSEKREQG